MCIRDRSSNVSFFVVVVLKSGQSLRSSAHRLYSLVRHRARAYCVNSGGLQRCVEVVAARLPASFAPSRRRVAPLVAPWFP
eukprot:10735431-Alexandrium_andersonii.AAC.1